MSNHKKSQIRGEGIETARRRSGLSIMVRLIGLVKPLLPVMLAAILLGTVGYLCAISLTILAGSALVGRLAGTVDVLVVLLLVLAVMRGILHYAEQYCNHFIAFKLLAIIRHKVFAALRRLCPAKLEGRDKGNLISIITTDIELLEVFYAHTVSPIAIAVLTCLTMVVFIGRYSAAAAVLALAGYVVVGLLIPLANGRKGAGTGMEFRTEFGELNSFVLDALRGLDETIQYGQGAEQLKKLDEKSRKLTTMQRKLKRLEGIQRSTTNMAILLFSFGMLFLMTWLQLHDLADRQAVVICTISMMGSFGPVVALSNLSNNLHQTLASGERVLRLLEEKPVVEEIEEPMRNPLEETDQKGKPSVEARENHLSCRDDFHGASVEQVTFAYEEEVILDEESLKIREGKITGIYGASGSGKSTLLKLLMRFWDVDRGSVKLSGQDVRTIPTRVLRDTESYVTQETHLFHTTIANNIAIGRLDATREEIMEAARKASIHEFIMKLPKGYDTEVGELGDTLSGGEKQRIGIARAFLHDAPLLLLDEPTSNLDSLNEGIILESLRKEKGKRTVVLVSHRKSTMSLADVVYEKSSNRCS